MMPRSAGIILAVLIAVGCATRVHADTISTFDVSGTGISSCLYVQGTPIPGCTPSPEPFSGLFTVDVTTGDPLAIDINFPAVSGFTGLPQYNPAPIIDVSPLSNGVSLFTINSDMDALYLDFTTATPGSLVGFDGGTIFGLGAYDSSSTPYYTNLTGSITPTPEPSSLILLLVGLAGLVAFAKRNAFGFSTHP